VGYDPVEMRASYIDPFPRSARVLELAAAPRDHAMHRADITCVGPLAPALSALASQLPAARTLWADGTPENVRAQGRGAFTCEHGAGFSPLDVASVLAQRLPASVPMTIDTGAHRILLSQAPIAQRVGQIAQSNGLCTMGYALPSAIGMSLALGGSQVVAAMGDGGFDMVLGELATLRDLALPVTIIVFDDQSLALIDLKQRALGYACRGVSLGATDHVALARAFGGEGERVNDRARLEDALQRALARPRGFSLISCALQPGAYKGLI
jgi:acetolactate synthase-1/2/3 large subunit